MSAVTQSIASAKLPDLIGDAIAKVRTGDAGAIFEIHILELLRKARQSDPAKWARIRAEAKEAKSNIAELDKLTAPIAETGSSAVFQDIEPWPDPVDGSSLLDEIVQVISRYVIAEQCTIRAAALWCAHTWAMRSWTVSPLANITAPEMRCGKTVLLAVIGKLVYRPLTVSNVTTSTLFRCIEAWSPTLLIDEVDSFLRENEEARGIINAGLYKESAAVLRCVGDDHAPTKFSVWTPKALCGIGKIAETLRDRSVPLVLRRKLPSERVENLRRSDSALWESLQRRLARWTDDNSHKLAAHVPEPHSALHDRANDCWEPLFAIADIAGSRWSQQARTDACALHGAEDDTPGINVELLTDIRQAFVSKSATRLATATILEHLVSDSDAPWSTWNRGKQMTARQLSSRLSGFDIRSKDLRGVGGKSGLKGYELADMQDALDRYLPAQHDVFPATTRQVSNDAISSDSVSATVALHVADEKYRKASNGAVCRGVADKNTLSSKGEMTI